MAGELEKDTYLPPAPFLGLPTPNSGCCPGPKFLYTHLPSERGVGGSAGRDEKGAPKPASDQPKSDRESDKGAMSAVKSGPPARHLPYPRQVILILAVDLAQSYAEFGEDIIQSLFLRQILTMPPNNYKGKAAEDFSVSLSYFRQALAACLTMPGAFLAQTKAIGPFKLLAFDSVGGMLANVVGSVAGVPDNEQGIPGNPRLEIWTVSAVMDTCSSGMVRGVSMPFGALQFEKGQEREQRFYFGFAYMTWNLAAFLTYVLTPVIRNRGCYGEESCYTWAYGSNAIIFALGTIAFLAGRPWYKVPPPTENTVKIFFGALKEAYSKWKSSKEEPGRPHWLDYGKEKYGNEYMEGKAHFVSSEKLYNSVVYFQVLKIYLWLPEYTGCIALTTLFTSSQRYDGFSRDVT